MSSQDVAIYLYELGSNERKLEYCRQILAANTNFIPQAIYNINFNEPKATISQQEFINILKTANVSCMKEQEDLIYSYFQIDNKNYLTFDQFASQMIPQQDQSLKKLITKRRKEQFSLDYGLKFSLQKFFFQIVENQVKLQLLCKFTFEKGKDEKKLRAKRIDREILKQFLGYHDKYPADSIAESIVRQLGLNKGESKRHKIISQYIIQYTEKKRKNVELPKVFTKELSAMKEIAMRYQTHVESFQKKAMSVQKATSALPYSKKTIGHKAANSEYSGFDGTPLSMNQNYSVAANTQLSKMNIFSNPTSNLQALQDRMKELMNSINTKNHTKSYKGSQEKGFQPVDKKQINEKKSNENQIIRKMKEEIKKEKRLQKSQVSQRQSNKHSSSKRQQNISQKEKSPFYQLTDSIISSRNAPNSDRHKVDSIMPKYSKISEENEVQSNLSSVTRGAKQLQKGQQKSNKYESLSNSSYRQNSSPSKTNKYNYDVKQKNEHKKRIQYLKRLIQQKDESRMS